jgi:hypothetical protein
MTSTQMSSSLEAVTRTFDLYKFVMVSCLRFRSAVSLAARLKALGVESVMSEQNAQVGDNWALRYDCLQFHVPTSFCDMPYMRKIPAHFVRM